MKMKNNKLEIMFEKQKFLQEHLNNDITQFNQNYFNIMILALIDELTEALRETPWKPWKQNQELNMNKLREEIIDAWHFLINISLLVGFDAVSLFEKFNYKNTININRKNNNY